MEEIKLTTYAEFQKKKLLQHLRPKGDPVLTILKGHLLVEELLREHLNKMLPNPKAIEQLDLSFNDCLCLVKAHHNQPFLRWLWEAIKKLNILRNKLAHNLEPKGFKDSIKDFIKYVEENTGKPSAGQIKKYGRLGLAMISVHASFTAHAE